MKSQVITFFYSHLSRHWSLGLATPASSTVAAIAYGDTEWISKKIMFKYATVFWVFNVLLLSTIGYALCTLLY